MPWDNRQLVRVEVIYLDLKGARKSGSISIPYGSNPGPYADRYIAKMSGGKLISVR